MSKTKLVLTDTFHLSQIAEEITRPRKDGSTPSKQAALNAIARAIAGPKHDWGYLTGAQEMIIQKGLRAGIPDALAARLITPDQVTPARQLVDRSRPYLGLHAKPAKLFSAEIAQLLREDLTGDFLAISEMFNTDGEDADPDQGVATCMFDPRAMIADEDSIKGLPLWGAKPRDLRAWSTAYFAASADEDLNRLISDAAFEIERQDETDFIFGCSYRAYYFAHALIVTPEYPFSCLAELVGDGAEEIDQDLGNQAFRIFVDETLGPNDQIKVLEQLEDFLNRLARWLKDGNPGATCANLSLRLAVDT